MGRKRLRVAVVGVGHLGEYHVQKYLALPEVDLVGVVDIHRPRLQEISGRYGIRAFHRLREILPMVDAVSLAVTTEMHFDVAKDILDAGVHVLIEKPITYCLNDADVLVRMAEEKGLVLQVGLVERFNPAVMKMESLLKNPVFLETHRMNQFTPRGIDVDVVLDLMIHDLDIVLHAVSSEVRELHAVGMRIITDKTDIANVRIIFEDGTVANLTASRVADKTMRKIRVFQPDAYMSVNYAKRKLTVIRMQACEEGDHPRPILENEEFLYPESDPLATEIASFVHAIVNGRKPVVTGRDGRNALKVALAIIEQIERGSRDFRRICKAS